MSKQLTYLAVALPLAVVLCASLAGAQRFAPGYCPTVTAHENFDKTKVSLVERRNDLAQN